MLFFALKLVEYSALNEDCTHTYVTQIEVFHDRYRYFIGHGMALFILLPVSATGFWAR